MTSFFKSRGNSAFIVNLLWSLAYFSSIGGNSKTEITDVHWGVVGQKRGEKGLTLD